MLGWESPVLRYTYRGDRMTADPLRGMQCDPVRDQRGKCITSKMATMLVVDGEGRRHVVLRRMLRINGERE